MNKFAFFFTSLFLFSFVLVFGQTLSELEWLQGEWIAVTENDLTVEKWDKISNNTFEGFGYTKLKRGNEVKNFESLRIVEMSGEVFYIAKVKHNNLPTAFKLTSLSDKKAVFENLIHDFPKEIIYLLKEEGKLEVTVSNEKRSFKIHFKKKTFKI